MTSREFTDDELMFIFSNHDLGYGWEDIAIALQAPIADVKSVILQHINTD